MGKWPNFEYIMSENNLNMIDLVINQFPLKVLVYHRFLVCGPIIPIRMGSPSFEAKFQLSGKTEQANAETFMSIPGERRTRMERTLPANPSKVTIGIITP